MIEDLKYLYYRDNVRTIEEFTIFARPYYLNQEELIEAYGYYNNKCFNSSSQVFKHSSQRKTNEMSKRTN